ncbi:antitoxin VapB family protein [Candidatus Micrarchaeota archaeon]|nr:antitoxin VapB family protein [Candidatus Micrarchaeota archaeon]
MARAIMVSDHVYSELLSLKGVNESFTKVIDRFLHASEEKKKTFMDFAGAWDFVSEKEVKRMEKAIKEGRRNWRPTPRW